MESEPPILKGIVGIFFNLKGYNISALTEHLSKSHNMPPETVILKKLCILNKFFIADYVNKNFAEDIMHHFKRVSSHPTKIEYIIGLFVIHQWSLKELMEQSLEEHRFHTYKAIQKEILAFLFNMVHSS